MTTRIQDDLARWFAPPDDPEIQARDELILNIWFKANPQRKQLLIDEGRRVEARAVLRRMLARRQLELSADDEARIDACTDLATLERWHDQAITAASAAEALR